MKEGNPSQKQGVEKENKAGIGKNFIDLDRVLKEKNPKLLKILPGFFIRYLKKIVHQEDLNRALYKFRDRMEVDFADAIIFKEFGVNLVIHGIEYMPDKRFIMAANHPLGGLDGMALISIIGKKSRELIVPSNDLLMNVPHLKNLFLPVNKHGSNYQNFKTFNQAFASDKPSMYFPAGLCSRKINGKVIDLEWKKTFVKMAKKHQRDILPTFVSGRNSNFFYILANLRKFFGIKANIEMLYLVNEMYKFSEKNKKLEVIIGKPIPWHVLDTRYTDKQWAYKIKKHVYALEKNKDLEFDPGI